MLECDNDQELQFYYNITPFKHCHIKAFKH
jgi:hypothetical protein